MKVRSTWIMLVIGLIFVVTGFLLVGGFGTTSADGHLVRYFCIGVGVLVGVTPGAQWGRAIYAIRNGRLGEAIVDKVVADPSSGATLDAVANGFAAGSWTVSLEGATFTEAFESDDTWSQALVVGTRVRVLVHPAKLKTVFHLGVAVPE